MPIEIWNEDTQEYKTRPLVLQITRNITSFMTFLIEFFREFLLGGVETIVSFTSWDWIDANPWAELPGLPWTIVAAATIVQGKPGNSAQGFASIQSQLVNETIVSTPPNKNSLKNSIKNVMKEVMFLVI